MYMNDKIEIGEYIKDCTGDIFKVAEIEYDEDEKDYWYKSNRFFNGCWSNQVVKHSNHLIDLIQVGDYVNTIKVIMKKETSKKWNQWEQDCIICANTTFSEDEIKSVLTKELFESMQYNIEEEEQK